MEHQFDSANSNKGKLIIFLRTQRGYDNKVDVISLQ